MTRVDDAVTGTVYNNGFEFKDAVKQANEYTYDANGNLTKDLNRNISNIQYNSLNLPGVVTFTDGSTVTYTYATDGTKLRTAHKTGTTTVTTDYYGTVLYENGTQKMLLTDEGYVTLPDKVYHYFQKDHLGNVRLVIGNPTSTSGNIKERNNYYAFGGLIPELDNVQPYKYNGKELDTYKGLNWHDYGARHYDAALGRWHTVDPMAEKYYSTSPYGYCLNNPVKYIDINGEAPGDIFNNVLDAAKDWAMFYNGAAILIKKEMGSYIYIVKSENGTIGYTYNNAVIGGEHSVKPEHPQGVLLDDIVASIHSHANYSKGYKDNEFSIADKKTNYNSGLIGYLATPNGSLLEHNPISGKFSIISTDIPSDPNDPERKNEIPPTNKPLEQLQEIKTNMIDFITDILKTFIIEND